MNPLIRKSFAQTSWRVLGKIAIVMVAALAYIGLQAIENSKNRFDREQRASFAVRETKGPETTDSVALSLETLNAALPSDIMPYVRQAKDRPFKNEDEFIENMNESILAEKEEQSRVHQDTLSALNKLYITARSNFISETSTLSSSLAQLNVDRQTIGTITDTIGKEQRVTKDNFPASIKQGPRDALIQKFNAHVDELLSARAAYNYEKESIARELQRIKEDAAKKIGQVYNSKGKIAEAVRQAKAETYRRDRFSNSILNEKSGNYAIYQVFWMLFMVTLVFGLLYLVLLALRPFPPFAASTETLTEQAKTFLKRGGGGPTPELARAAVVTVAALGIGTAVVVAGGATGNRGNRVVNGTEYDMEIQSPAGRRTSTTTRLTGGGRQGTGETPNIEVTSPIVYPSPMTLQSTIFVPSSDRPSIDRLEGKVDALGQTVGGQTTELSTVKGNANQTATSLAEFKREVSGYNLPEIQRQTSALSTGYPLLSADVSQLQRDQQQLAGNFLQKVDTASTTLQGIRDDSLNALQSPTQRNFFGRLGRLFGKSSYMVSEQSYRALVSLICKVPCDGPQCTAPCTDPSDPSDTRSMILRQLKEEKGKPPRDEGEFLRAFGGSGALGQWKSIILKFTRVSY